MKTTNKPPYSTALTVLIGKLSILPGYALTLARHYEQEEECATKRVSTNGLPWTCCDTPRASNI